MELCYGNFDVWLSSEQPMQRWLLLKNNFWRHTNSLILYGSRKQESGDISLNWAESSDIFTLYIAAKLEVLEGQKDRFLVEIHENLNVVQIFVQKLNIVQIFVQKLNAFKFSLKNWTTFKFTFKFERRSNSRPKIWTRSKFRPKIERRSNSCSNLNDVQIHVQIWTRKTKRVIYSKTNAWLKMPSRINNPW